jgi:hypothetical protein
MKGDFTRVTFRPRNHHSGVLQQQGRVQLDADWNEQVAIGAHIDRTTTRDLLGGCGAPCDAPGFALTCAGTAIPAAGCAPEDLRIEAGRYYVDGILVENDEPVDLAEQPDLPGVVLPDIDGRYLAYLDVWEEHLTTLERPGLREVALGGPDTATRTRTIWQVKLEPVGAGPVCSDFGDDWIPTGVESTGRLAARAATSGPITDPCIIPPGAGFRRLENQLYRVEIHDGSQDAAGAAQTPTYKWSRDNGSVVLLVSGIVDTVISVVQPARDNVLGFATGDWVEISDEGRTLRGEPGILVELADAQGTELTVTGWSGGPPALSPDFATTVRRWDSVGALDVVRGSWLDVEDGVQIRFDNVAAQTYRTGDHWQIPARSADIEGVATNVGGNVEWPLDPATNQPEFQTRHGIHHHYCAIATLERTTGGGGTAVWTEAVDCRSRFPALTDLTQLEFVGGDGQEAMPGDPLPKPLEVGVWNGGCAIEAAVVRFVTTDGGTLTSGANTGPDILVPVDADAIASCTWTLDPDWAKPSQRTRATLLDDHGNPVGLPIDFNANLSIASEVAYDPTGCEALKDEVTVQDAIDHLAAASALVVRCGDGQEAMPAEPLPQPLEVEVASACGPTEGANVEFKADGAGRVAASVADLPTAGATFTAVTGPDGRASVAWLLDPVGPPSQRVEVSLVVMPGDLVEEPTGACFTGRLSIASQVEYDGGCEHMAKADTVQDALDLLCANAGLHHVSGDGQEGGPGQKVPHPLQVRVANGGWPSKGVKVLFAVVEGNGTIVGDAPVDPTTVVAATNANGIAQVGWTLGLKGRQRVEARLSDDPKSFVVAFNAQFSDGGGGVDPEPGIRIKEVFVAGHPLPNDGEVGVGELDGGIIVNFDGVIDSQAARGGPRAQPVMTVTVDVPFAEDSGGPAVALQPFIVRANLDAMGDQLLWVPWDSEVLAWLAREVKNAQPQGFEGLLTHLVLKGNFIWAAEDPSVFVDGDSFGAPGDGRTEILRDAAALMSGDGRRGGDFEMWFWLVP